MKVALVLAIAAWLVGCNGGSANDGCDRHGVHFANGATWTELCNQCTCTKDGVSCTAVGCGQPIDANPSSCTPSAGCAGFGPQCGTSCCNAGERCVGGKCMCGTQPGCGDTDRCGGPVMQNDCGEVCCGGTRACPL